MGTCSRIIRAKEGGKEIRVGELTLDKRAFLRQVHEDPTLAYRILEGMSQRIRRLDQELSGFRGRPSPEPAASSARAG